MEKTSGSHVLVVDDDLNLCRTLREYLRKNDFCVSAINSGRQMLQLIARESIDVLLMEVGLPGEHDLVLIKTERGVGYHFDSPVGAVR
jgi:DNA-binding response OmpR family regulator